MAYGIAFLFKKQFKSIPFLSFGFIIYGFVGLVVKSNFWWFITDNPYKGAKDIYGSGTLTHYFEHYEEITGIALGILIVVGFLFWIIDTFKNFKNIFSVFSLVILLPTALYIAGHSYVWWKGLSGSLGLLRVMGGITPLLVVVGLYGLNNVVSFLEKNVVNKVALRIVVLLIPILFVYTSYSKYNGFITVGANDIDKLVVKSMSWLEKENLLERKTYVYKPEYLAKYGADHFDKANSRVSQNIPNTEFPEQGLNPGDIIIWDGHLSPNEGRLPLSRLMQNSQLKLLKSFKPKQDIIVLGGHKYSIEIFEKI
jgi:hypothetical protein